MAEIIVFEKWREQNPGRSTARSELSVMGQVLIFTGVRYERHDPVNGRPVILAPVRAEN